MNNHWKNKAWKYATAIVVAIIILNPEMAELALFIDAVGLELFFMLIEIQILVALGMVRAKLRLYFVCMKNSYKHFSSRRMWQNIKEEPESLLLFVPSQATIMSLLVFTAFIDILFKNMVLVA